MFFVFLDTSAIEAEGFAFKTSKALVALANAVADGHVTVVMTDLTDKEVRRRIRERVGPAMEAVKKQYVLDAMTLADFHRLRGLQKDEVVGDIIAQWETYLASLSSTVVSVDSVAPTDVMDAFFNVEPPFSGKKPTEFRDAFVIASLKKWAEENRQHVLVVATDPDYVQCCDGQRLVHVVRLADALKQTISDVELERAVVDALVRCNDELVSALSEQFSGLGMQIEEDWNADISGVSVKRVDLDVAEFSIIEAREGHVVTEGKARIEFIVEGAIADYDNSPRDEGDYVFLLHDTIVVAAKREFAISVTFVLGGIPPMPEAIDSIDFEGGRVVELSLNDADVTWRKRYDDADARDDDDST